MDARVSAQEIGTGLDLIARKGAGRPAPVACCPHHEEPTPLIGTIVFAYNEFYCLDCGCRFGFLEPRTEDASEGLSARLKTYQAEWDENVSGKLMVEGREPLDREAHYRALAWLDARIRRTV